MLKLFQNTKPSTVLIIILLAFAMKWQVLLHPVLPSVSKGHFLFGLLFQVVQVVFHNAAIAYSLFAVTLLIIQAFYLNFIVTKHKLFAQNSQLPAFSFLLFTSFFPALNYFSEEMLVSFFVLAGVEKILGFSHVTNPGTQIFNAAYLLSIPLLFQLSGIFFFILFLASLALLRPFQLTEWFIGFIGLFIPIYFFVCFLFLFNKMDVLPHFPLLNINYLEASDFKGFHLILLCGFFILIATGLFALQQNLPRVTIYVRRSWLVLLCYSLMALCIVFFSSSSLHLGWILLMSPLSLIISQSFCLEKPKRFSSFTFYFSIVLFIFSQLI